MTVLFDSFGRLTPSYADVEAALHNTAGQWSAGGSVQPDLGMHHPSLGDVRVTGEGRTPGGGRSIQATAVWWSS